MTRQLFLSYWTVFGALGMLPLSSCNMAFEGSEAGSDPAGDDDDSADDDDDNADDDDDSSLDTDSERLQLPFLVNQHFTGGGYMGDWNRITASACESDDSPETLCIRFTVRRGDEGWAGVAWLFPPNNWGDRRGLAIATGAKKVSFSAWVDGEPTVVHFIAGGVGDPRTAYMDDFILRKFFKVSAERKKFTLRVDDFDIDHLICAFSWVVDNDDWPDDIEEFTINIDDLRWH